MSANKIPEVINDMRVYVDGEDTCMGVATVELPSITCMTQSVSGIGMAGEVNSPVLGHFESMETVLNWRTPTPRAIAMSGGAAVALECRAAIQNWDSGANSYVMDSYRIVIRGRAKEFKAGSLESANTSDSSNTIETTYLKIELNGETIRMIDKYGYIDSTSGVNSLDTVRRALGLG